MGLANAQTLLARLFTDSLLRERFLADPRTVASEFGVTPDEASTLERLSAIQVRRFAASLCLKRRNELGKFLSLSRHALGESRFDALFRSHEAGHSPRGASGLRADAIALARGAERQVRNGGFGPVWVADLLRFEAARLLAADPDRCWTCVVLRHSLVEMVRCARTGSGETPSQLRTIIVWFRRSRHSRLRNLSISRFGLRWS